MSKGVELVHLRVLDELSKSAQRTSESQNCIRYIRSLDKLGVKGLDKRDYDYVVKSLDYLSSACQRLRAVFPSSDSIELLLSLINRHEKVLIGKALNE